MLPRDQRGVVLEEHVAVGEVKARVGAPLVGRANARPDSIAIGILHDARGRAVDG
jgi:hypothetical protein